MYDLLLKNAWVVDPLNSVNGVADVAIQDSKIAKVQRDITEEAKEVIDFTGKTLQPGIIDSHVHLGEMWGSPFGPRMLAMNGVTTCLDMAGPLENILDNVPKYGVGINMGDPPVRLSSLHLQGCQPFPAGNDRLDRQIPGRRRARCQTPRRPLSA